MTAGVASSHRNTTLSITHEHWGSSSDHSLNDRLHYPHDLDGPLNEVAAAKIRQYRTDYNNRPSSIEDI